MQVYSSAYDASSPNSELPPWHGRAILLVDLDAFFASVEQLDHPEWRGKPVIVGGSADKRGVVSTASYEARKFGVHSAMPSWQAKRLCPNAIWTFGNYPRYSEMSRKVMNMIWDETPLVQQVSIDEAFADVTPGKRLGDHPVVIARRIKDRVSELGITCSVGVSTTKTISKIASDMDKPDGLVVVYPGEERAFLNPLPVGKISGIGKKSVEKLTTYGINTIGDLAEADEKLLHSIFGINAQMMLDRARGIENSPIETSRPVKSVSNEQTFERDLEERDEILAAIDMVSTKLGRRLRRKGLAGYTVTLKVRYHDLSIHTAQRTGSVKIDSEGQMTPVLHELLDEVWRSGIGLRLVGVGISEFGEKPEQLSLFGMDDAELAGLDNANGASSGIKARTGTSHSNLETSKRATGAKPKLEPSVQELQNIAKATDKVKDLFGEGAVRYGRELRFDGKDTGTMSQHKDIADLQASLLPSRESMDDDSATYEPDDGSDSC